MIGFHSAGFSVCKPEKYENGLEVTIEIALHWWIIKDNCCLGGENREISEISNESGSVMLKSGNV
jgi:hypothetical protein